MTLYYESMSQFSFISGTEKEHFTDVQIPQLPNLRVMNLVWFNRSFRIFSKKIKTEVRCNLRFNLPFQNIANKHLQSCT